jgi:hypothetical protein
MPVILMMVYSPCSAAAQEARLETKNRNILSGPGFKLLQVPLKGQETRLWCWAASGQMITQYFFGEGVPQFRQANLRLERTDCGPAEPPGVCVKGGVPQFHTLKLSAKREFKPLTWEQLTAQIDAGKPVGFAWQWKRCNSPRPAPSHYMVARGYLTFDGVKMVVVNDPLPQPGKNTKGGTVMVMNYRDYVKFCHKYRHQFTHCNITEKETTPRAEGQNEN